MLKKEARQIVAERVAELSVAEREWASDSIADALISLELFKKCARPFIYMSTPLEVDTEAILSIAFALNKRVCVPKLKSKEEMAAILITPYTKYLRNSYGIAEPITGREVDDCDIAIVPLAAYDGLMRVGRGGGHYDRYFASHPDMLKVGIAFDCCEVEGVKIEQYDVQLDVLITEKKIVTRTDKIRITSNPYFFK